MVPEESWSLSWCHTSRADTSVHSNEPEQHDRQLQNLYRASRRDRLPQVSANDTSTNTAILCTWLGKLGEEIKKAIICREVRLCKPQTLEPHGLVYFFWSVAHLSAENEDSNTTMSAKVTNECHKKIHKVTKYQFARGRPRQRWSQSVDAKAQLCQAATKSISPESGPGSSQGVGDIHRGAAQTDPQLHKQVTRQQRHKGEQANIVKPNDMPRSYKRVLFWGLFGVYFLGILIFTSKKSKKIKKHPCWILLDPLGTSGRSKLPKHPTTPFHIEVKLDALDTPKVLKAATGFRAFVLGADRFATAKATGTQWCDESLDSTLEMSNARAVITEAVWRYWRFM